eukprot:7965067-Ditylum_brightwellii.AAC.1
MGDKGGLGIGWCQGYAHGCPKYLKPVTISKCEDVVAHGYLQCIMDSSDGKVFEGLLVLYK